MALKQMEKQLIECQGKQEHIKNEKRVLIKGKSPFLVRMHYSFQTEKCLYIAMEYCPGGDLREFLSQIGTLEEEEALIYIAEMIMAVHTLHKMGYIHRDLKPDNFLIDGQGHLKLADFGLSKSSVIPLQPGMAAVPQATPKFTLLPAQAEKLKETKKRRWQAQKEGHQHAELTKRPSKLDLTKISQSKHQNLIGVPQNLDNLGMVAKRKRLVFSVVGSPDYMSPEVTSGLIDSSPKGYSEEVDWWSLGCVCIEMLLGAPPFTGATPDEIFDNIHNWKTILPEIMESYRVYMTSNCFTLLSGFLCEPSERLGKDIKKLQSHPFFKETPWDNLHSLKPPFVPQTPEWLLDETTASASLVERPKEPFDEELVSAEKGSPSKLTADLLAGAMEKAASRGANTEKGT